MQVEYARTPQWANTNQTAIRLWVKFADIDIEVPFTASPDDSESYGRNLYLAAASGQYGSVAEYVAPPVMIPESITRRQARLALLSAGLLEQVEQLINDPLTSPEIKIVYQDSTHWYRDDPILINLATPLGLDSDQLDQLFLAASSL
jgi:hypothetical protein